MDRKKPSVKLTPKDYEIAVKNFIKAKGDNLTDFQVEHLEDVKGLDGEYEIDVTARFSAFEGAEFLVLIECKHYITSVVDRDKVMVLNQKLQSIGAHKGMMFTTSKYQRGAIEFAQAHKISLAKFDYNDIMYSVKAIFVDAYEVSIDEDGETKYELICDKNALLEE